MIRPRWTSAALTLVCALASPLSGQDGKEMVVSHVEGHADQYGVIEKIGER